MTRDEGRRPPLNRATIIAAALTSIDERGLPQLSMRTLAQELDVVPMALYRHVSGREDLLEGVVDLLMTDLHETLDPGLAETWQGYLQSLAHAVRQIAVDHAAAFPLVATRHPAAPWLRPPLRSIELVESCLRTLCDFGFSDHQASDAYRAFSSFLLGQLLLESAARGASTAPAEEPLDEGDAPIPNRDARVDLGDSPVTRRLQPLLSVDRSDEEFEVGLETLLERLEMHLAQ